MVTTALGLRRLLPIILALLPGCAGGLSVKTSHDPEVDFTKLHTFDWMSAPTEADRSVNDPATLGVIGKELEAHGLKQDKGQPDLLVAVHRTIEGMQETNRWGYDLKNGRIEKY